MPQEQILAMLFGQIRDLIFLQIRCVGGSMFKVPVAILLNGLWLLVGHLFWV